MKTFIPFQPYREHPHLGLAPCPRHGGDWPGPSGAASGGACSCCWC